MAVELSEVRRLLALELGLGVVSTARLDGTVASSFVNCGLFPHPISGATTLAVLVKPTRVYGNVGI